MSEQPTPRRTERPQIDALGVRAIPEFRRAQRHSAFVRFVKRALPVSLILALAAMIVVPLISRMGLKIDLPFEVGAMHLSGTRLTMEKPKLSGFTDDNRAYAVNAATASQDLTNTDVLDLTEVSARMELANKGWATVKSATGTVDMKRQFITLRGGVDLATNGGYAGLLKDADVDAKAGSLSTDKPVLLTYMDGRLVADRMKVFDRGTRAFFEGNVQLDFRLSNLSNGGTQGTAGAAGAPSAAPANMPAPAPASPAATQKR
ncbi:hypothetical protein V5F77_16380 [Xanthobacter sp. DSM 24535]|uniref:hypothetical protein n=1 Tax=Roseixanthobacter psychrophilus TaxID=3119917 RepID=UPI00372C2E4B